MIRPVFNDITLQPVFAFWIVEWARVRKMRLGQPAQVSSIELSTTGVFVLILLTFSLISIFVNPIYALSSTAISNQTWKVTDGGIPQNFDFY
ncbi:hypothetical protein C6502_01895 [Candidatus Poribacteria bacterium]|nr:MAG: hypothetical protein C6502_01895 [Candidatus Poribacteria bacterium]